MRERFDFSSISGIILAHRKRSGFSYTQYYNTVFSHAFTQENVEIQMLDDTNTGKIINGVRGVQKEIIGLYRGEEGFNHLRDDVERVLEEIFDLEKMVVQLLNLLQKDNTLPHKSKDRILGYQEDIPSLVAACIIEGVERESIKREKADYTSRKKFDLSDYLYGYQPPVVSKVFLGRDQDIQAIHNQLKADSCLFLQGIGGIGKSELAKRYGKYFKKEYDNILYMHYDVSLYQTICNLDFIDDTPDMDEKDRFDLHYKLFKNMDAKTLVILDNFNTIPENDDLFLEFMALSFRLLITTKSHLEGVSCYQVKEFELMEDLEELFYAYAPKGRKKQAVVRTIIEVVHRHTLTVEMAAKIMTASALEPEDLLETLKADGLYLPNRNKIRLQKDAKTKKDRISNHIERLFQLQKLPDEHRHILCHMLLVPAAGIPKSMFGRLLEEADFNHINYLIESGWVQEDINTSYISMHPYLQEILKGRFLPTTTKCELFLKNLGIEYTQTVTDGAYYHMLLGMVKSVFHIIKVDNHTIAFHLMNQMLEYMEGCMYLVSMKWLLDLMHEIFPLNKEHPKETATYELYRGTVALNSENIHDAETHCKYGLGLIEPVDDTTVILAIRLHSLLGNYYFYTLNFEASQEQKKIAVELNNMYQLPQSPDSCIEKSMLLMASLLNGDVEEAVTAMTSWTDESAPDDADPLSSFLDNIREMGNMTMSSQELETMMQQVNLDEMKLPPIAEGLFDNVVADMQEYSASGQESFSLKELSFASISSVLEHYNEKKE